MKQILISGLILYFLFQVTMAQEHGKGKENREEKGKPNAARVDKKEEVKDKKTEADFHGQGGQEDMKKHENDELHPMEKKEKEQQMNKMKTDSLQADSMKHGNAYGKNKGDLSGKEFGQQRAADAKAAALEKKELAIQKIREHEQQITANEERIKASREKVDKQMKASEITAEEAKVKTEKINQAEEMVKKMKELVKKEKEDLEELDKTIIE